jgi:isopentenyl diphosphate isomerase/L-lactate dehydrogenase-like FMN-dependent dehydrogenase
MMVPTLDLDLSVALFGDTHFTPIVVGPVAEQRRYHPEGELATQRGAAAARTAMIVSGRSSVPLAEIAAHAGAPIWYATYADAGARHQIDQARAAAARWSASRPRPLGHRTGNALRRPSVAWRRRS